MCEVTGFGQEYMIQMGCVRGIFFLGVVCTMVNYVEER